MPSALRATAPVNFGVRPFIASQAHTTMNLTELAALVGALAWAPPIFTAVRSWLTKPALRVITQPSPEVGYTTFGPILNLRLALTVKHRDIVITGVKLRLTHESGEETVFSWRGITQRLGQFNAPQVGTVPFEKELNVLAMKVSEKDIEERFIRFQSLTFLERKTDLDSIATKKLFWHRQNDTFSAEDFLRNQEMTEIYEFIKQSFSWKPGGYRLKFLIESPDAFELTGDEYTFSLTPMHVQDLSSNLSLIDKSYKNEVLPPPETDADRAERNIVWKWVYPEMLEEK